MQPVSFPVVQVRPNAMVIYPYTIWPGGVRPRKNKSAKHLSISLSTDTSKNFENAQAYSGVLKPHSRKRLQKAINLLVAIAEPKRITPPKVKKAFTFEVNFVTLTLPAPQRTVSDRELKTKCLDPFIKAMRYHHQLKNYVWRAERQYNGNLHFHLTTDTYLPQDSIRNEWNRQLSKFHFIDEFHSKHGYATPNSTDVHAVWKINNIAAYMVKYMSKDAEEHLADVNIKRLKAGKEPLKPEEHEFRSIDGQPEWTDPIDGKVWDCSQALKSKDRCEIEAYDEIKTEVNRVTSTYNLNTWSNEHCTMVFSNGFKFEKILSGELRNLYRSYLHRIKTGQFSEPINYAAIYPSVAEPEPLPEPPPKSAHSDEVQTALFEFEAWYQSNYLSNNS